MTCNQSSHILMRIDIFENYFKEKFLNFDCFLLRKYSKDCLKQLFPKKRIYFFVLTMFIKRCFNKSTLLIKELMKTVFCQ